MAEAVNDEESSSKQMLSISEDSVCVCARSPCFCREKKFTTFEEGIRYIPIFARFQIPEKVLNLLYLYGRGYRLATGGQYELLPICVSPEVHTYSDILATLREAKGDELSEQAPFKGWAGTDIYFWYHRYLSPRHDRVDDNPFSSFTMGLLDSACFLDDQCFTDASRTRYKGPLLHIYTAAPNINDDYSKLDPGIVERLEHGGVEAFTMSELAKIKWPYNLNSFLFDIHTAVINLNKLEELQTTITELKEELEYSTETDESPWYEYSEPIGAYKRVSPFEARVKRMHMLLNVINRNKVKYADSDEESEEDEEDGQYSSLKEDKDE